MSKLAGTTWKPAPRNKKTSQGGRNSSIKMSSMNKSAKRGYKPSQGQG